MAHGLVWLAAFLVYGKWVDRPGGYERKSVVGIAMAYGCLLSQLMPCLGFSCLPEPIHDPELQYRLGIWFLVSVGVLGLVGVICFSSRMKSQRILGACPTEGDSVTPGETVKTFRLARETLAGLQWDIWERIGRPVPLHLTESLTLPLLVGLNPNRIYVPVLFALKRHGLESLVEPLARWSLRKRYRGYMFLWWLAQFHVLLQPLTTGIRRALEQELAREAGADPLLGERYRTAVKTFGLPAASGIPLGLVPLDLKGSGVPGHRWPWGFLPVMGLVGLCGWGSWLSGGFNPYELYLALSKGAVVGYSLHAYDGAVRFRPMPGQGGVLPDGLMVDTRLDAGRAGCSTVRFPLGLNESERLVPFGAEALRIHLEWKALERPGLHPDPPALKINCSEQTRIDGKGHQQLYTFYTRNLILPQDSTSQGHFDIPIRLHPEQRSFSNSTDVIYGPIAYVPKGWQIEFSNYSIEKISVEEVPPVPAGEVERFVAWYRRNGGRPAHPDLRWGAVAGPPASTVR